MNNEKNIRRVLEAMEQIDDVLPSDRAIAFEALTFSLVNIAVDAGLSAAEIQANIDKAIRARQVAARQVMS